MVNNKYFMLVHSTIFIVPNMQALSINEFLKPAEGENYYGPGGRGRGRGRGQRGGYSRGNIVNNAAAPAIEDVNQFPSLGAK